MGKLIYSKDRVRVWMYCNQYSSANNLNSWPQAMRYSCDQLWSVSC